MKFYATALGTFLAACSVSTAPAFALSNPIVVDLQQARGSARAASATIFGSGASVLVNVTGERNVPKGAAITLNTGSCSNPGDIAFALTQFSDNASMTKLEHPLADVADKAKSMVIHTTSSQTSPVLACGTLRG